MKDTQEREVKYLSGEARGANRVRGVRGTQPSQRSLRGQNKKEIDKTMRRWQTKKWGTFTAEIQNRLRNEEREDRK